MILCGNPGINLRCKEYYCVLNNKFNVVLFTENSVIVDGTLHSLGFIVPTDYYSFLKTANIDSNSTNDILKIFQFEKESDQKVLLDYIKNLPKTSQGKVIKDLTPPKNKDNKDFDKSKTSKFNLNSFQ